ncbi:MAG: ATP-binding protein [Pseudomonadota bacterium]|nr:ATP-binding protein [Pseudomonadota bacterium]
MKLLLLIGGLVAALGLFLLATASGDTALFARHYALLLGLNAALASLLAALVGYQLVALVRRYRARVFGTRLTLRLLTRFAALAVLPGLIVYAVSVQFLTRSIESWFDVKVDAALEGGINLGHQAIDQMMLDLQAKANAMALELAEHSPAQLLRQLERLRAQAGVQEAVVVTAGGRLVASASEDVSKLVPELPGAQLLRQARSNRGYTAVDSVAGRPLSLRVVVPVDALGLASEGRFLQLRSSVSPTFARSAEAVEAAYRDYRELAIAREELKRIYVVTLSFALLMALFVAVAVAATQSNLLAAPLATLAQAMQAVARGDLSRQAPVTSRDELGVLTESFNSMTRQLDDARRVVEANRVALEAAKARLESILANLSAGVLVFDHDLELSISNHGASAILGAELGAFAQRMRAQFVELGDKDWQLELQLKGTGKTLHARGARLPQATGGGYVLVFDDFTQLIQAQRATAWAEVARRLAHEIKNPLTPIQLSAERLEMKLADRLPRADADTLKRSIQTIVNQVAALKAMVDDFRDYARVPAPVLAQLDLNALASEVLALYENSPVPVVERLADRLPAVWADGAQMRQVIHNLVQNAQDALENAGAAGASPQIEVRTELAGDRVRLAVSDNGGGFPEELMTRIFEPYVTTKPRGTGLGLAIVKKIIDEHHGSVSIENRPSRGASVSVLLPLAKAV